MTIKKRPELLDEATRRFLNVLLPPEPPAIPRRRRKPPIRKHRPIQATGRAPSQRGDRDIQKLADDMIKKRCGTHSLGLIYDFLLKTCDSSTEARAEFVKFLSGEWSQRWIEAAALKVAEEQRASRMTSPENLTQNGDASVYDDREDLRRPNFSLYPIHQVAAAPA